MATLPTVAARIRTTDYDLMRVQDNLGAPLDALLADSTALHNGKGSINVLSSRLGTATATAISSDKGFKCTLGPATYYNPAYPGGAVAGVIPVVNGAAASTTPFTFVAPFAGSVMGMSYANSGGVAVTCAATVIKNGVTLWSTNVSTGPATGYATATKPAFTFVAGDVLTVSFNFSAAVAVNVQLHITVQMEA